MSDPSKFIVSDAVERQSGRFSCQLRDENSAVLGAAALTSLTLTLYDVSSNTIVNSRSAQSVLNANQGTVDSNGSFVWIWVPLDMVILNTNRQQEEHVALLTAKWTGTDGVARQANHEVHFFVNRIPQVS